MANLVVSAACNQDCEFCFARKSRQEFRAGLAAPYLSLEAFDDRLDFLQTAGIGEIRLIGGEPTLHPNFPELVKRALEQGGHLVVFTNGLIPASALACLEAISPGACTVLVNMNSQAAAGEDAALQPRQRIKSIDRLGPRVILGYTIYSTAVQLEGALKLIDQHKCRRRIRLGLAQPIVNGGNRYLHPKQYPQVGRQIARLAQQAAAEGIRLEFDCGFVRCMFSEEDFKLIKRLQPDLELRCSPVLDIHIDGSAFHCFPLAERVKTRWEPRSDAAALRLELERQARGVRQTGIYRECSSCRFKKAGECTGGCLAATWLRFHQTPLQFRVPEGILRYDQKNWMVDQEEPVTGGGPTRDETYDSAGLDREPE